MHNFPKAKLKTESLITLMTNKLLFHCLVLQNSRQLQPCFPSYHVPGFVQWHVEKQTLNKHWRPPRNVIQNMAARCASAWGIMKSNQCQANPVHLGILGIWHFCLKQLNNFSTLQGVKCFFSKMQHSPHVPGVLSYQANDKCIKRLVLG